MQNIINLDSKNIKHYLTGREKIIVLGFLVIVFSLLFSGSAFADNVNYSVNIAPSLKLTIPDSSLILNLNPPTKTFDSKNLTVTVGTNNTTGYKLTLSTPDNNTNLNRDNSGDSVSATIPTLDTGTYTESTFTANKWGYKINSNTAIPSTITTDYIPFVSGNTLMESDIAVNHDETELTFAAKIDYLQPSGAYNTTLQFNIVANPLVDYMQNFTPEMCRTLASSDNYTVVDKRDGQEYTVRHINGECWMTRNLAIGCNGNGPTYGSVITPIELTADKTNIQISYTTPTVSAGSGADNATPRIACSSNYGAWYNLLAASAGTHNGTTTVYDDITYNICPKNWTLPTFDQASGVVNYKEAFSPIKGGAYYNGTYYRENIAGYWWLGKSNSGGRNCLGYNDNLAVTCSNAPKDPIYVRCILKQP